MPDKKISNNDAEDKFQTLLSNANAARIISQAIEGTIGPKGLDIMMVDRFGDVVISNDGVTILKLMEVNHPVARMIINAARSQQAEVGDGTTTATIIAGCLIAEGANQVIKGVPVTQVLQGIQIGIEQSISLIEKNSCPISSVDDPRLMEAALIAGRGQNELTGLVMEGVKLLGKDRLLTHDYRFADAVVAREGADNQAFSGILINKMPINQDMPRSANDVRILVIDDALAPEEMDNGARSTEAGFQYYLQSKELYEKNLRSLCELGVNLVLVDRNIDDIAEQVFTEAGIIAIQRVSHREMEQVCKHTGARKIKRVGLNRSLESIATCLGKATRVEVDEKLKHTCVLNGEGEIWVTVLIGAATEEVVDERERIAKDAAAAVQAALRGGIVPGGGAMEIWVAQQVEDLSREKKGMVSYGVLCVKEALIRPFSCITANAGFNPLEKLGDVIAEQKRRQVNSVLLDCDNGNLIDAWDSGIVDPALVKIHAIKAGGEVALAILRINTIIKMRNGESPDNDMVE